MSENYLLVDSKGNATEIEGDTKIGRSKTNEVVLTDPLASRHHATVYYQDDVLMIRDEQSVNGTIVNRGQIYDPAVLNDRDTIQFGDEVFTVRAPLTEAKTVRKPKKAAEVEPTAAKKAEDTAMKPKTPVKKASVPPKTPPPAPPVTTSAPVGEEVEPKKSNNQKILLIAGGALLVLCICCIVVGVVINSMGLSNSFGF